MELILNAWQYIFIKKKKHLFLQILPLISTPNWKTFPLIRVLGLEPGSKSRAIDGLKISCHGKQGIDFLIDL